MKNCARSKGQEFEGTDFVILILVVHWPFLAYFQVARQAPTN